MGLFIYEMMGGTREQIGYSVKNMIANITGMICDGAKPSCALKVSNGVSSATLSALMAIDNKVISAVEGITDEDVDKTILNLTRIGRDGMQETDRMILEIMTSK
jgi:L-cysteine desulfidase